MFEEGDIVICTNNMDDDGHVWPLTVGKEYEITASEYMGFGGEVYIEVTNDRNEVTNFRKLRFKRAPLFNKPATVEVMY